MEWMNNFEKAKSGGLKSLDKDAVKKQKGVLTEVGIAHFNGLITFDSAP